MRFLVGFFRAIIPSKTQTIQTLFCHMFVRRLTRCGGGGRSFLHLGHRRGFRGSGALHEVERINLWTQPRSASTSLMYSFKQRGDCLVVDEPLYAHYIAETGEQRPYQQQLFEEQSEDLNVVLNDVIFSETHKTVNEDLIFFKHMGKQLLPGDDWKWILRCKNIILLRHPRKVLQSFHTSLASTVNPSDSGVQDLRRIYQYATEHGQHVPVVLNEDLLKRPEGTLAALCKSLDIPFTKNMLRWEKGGIEEEGCWKHVWYHNSHATTGFTSPPTSPTFLRASPEVEKACKYCLDDYMALKAKRVLPLPVLPDERNKDIYVYVGGKLLHRDEAKISVFDSIVQGG